MVSQDDDSHRDWDALKDDGSESPIKARKRKKEVEFTAKQLERDPIDRKRGDIGLLGDGITYLDPEYNERYGAVQFYDEPNANADYEHCGQVPVWSSAEAAALSLEKDPQIVTPESIKPFIQESDFPKKYMQRLNLIERSMDAGALRFDPKSRRIKPIDFIEWAKQMQLDIPSELINAIEGHSKNMEREQQFMDDQKHPDVLSRSVYWQELQSKTLDAIDAFPGWAAQQKKITSERVKDWLKTQPIGADYREADLIKKVLSDIFQNCP